MTVPMLMSLKSIADLAQVKRNTVTTWRSRYGVDSEFPFPRPEQSSQLTTERELFDCDAVASWLEETGRTKGRDVHGDAPFHSQLFESACTSPLEYLAALRAMSDNDSPDNGLGENSSRITKECEILIEAAFGVRPLLTQIRQRLVASHKERLSCQASAALSEAIVRTLRSNPAPLANPAPLVAATPMAAALIADVLGTLESDPVVPFDPDSFKVYIPVSHSAGTDHVLEEIVVAELDQFGVTTVRFVIGHDEIPANSLVLSVCLSSTTAATGATAAQSYFNQLESLLTDIGSDGAVLAIAPAPLLVGSSDDKMIQVRQKFLAASESGYVEPLRYSATLPRRWAPLAGQLQPSMWVFKRPAQDSFPVVLADISGICDSEIPTFVSNLTTALVEPEQFPYCTLLNGTVETAPQVLRLGLVSSTGQTNRHIVQLPPDAISFAGNRTGLSPAASVGDLWATAQRTGIDPEAFAFINGEPYQSLVTIPWDLATHRGRYQVLSVIPGTKFSRSSNQVLSNSSIGSGIGIVGPDELNDVNSWDNRTIDLISLDEHYPRAALTEPGDVIIARVKGADRSIAVVDHIGSHVVEAPAFAVRCKKFRGRSRTPLDHCTLPQLVANAINESNTVNRSSWRIPVVSHDMSAALSPPLTEIQKKREQLLRSLNNLEKLENDLIHSAVTGAIAPLSNPPPNQRPPDQKQH